MTKQNLWESIQNSIREGVQFAAEKTEEMTRIGKIKYEIFQIKRSIENAFTDLGGKYYHWHRHHTDEPVTADQEIQQVIDKIMELEQQLQAKQEELEAVARPSEEAEGVHSTADDTATAPPAPEDSGVSDV